MSFLILLSLVRLPQALAAETVKMRVVVVNPSTTKTQTTSIKNYLPKEVTLKDVKDASGLEIDYDEEQGLFYAHKKDVELAPSETKVFELVMTDVWMVPDEQLDQYQKKTQRALDLLKDTAYFPQAELIAKTILGRLEDIKKTQNDLNVPKQQHIAYYRDNLKILNSVREDLDKLEKILVAVSGAPNLEVLEKSDVNLKSPSSKTTWVIIFVVFIFVGILSATFYFTWMRQEKLTENIFTKEKDSSFGEFKGPPPTQNVPTNDPEKSN